MERGNDRDWLTGRQARHNRETRGARAEFAAHRLMVTSLIMGCVRRPTDRVCVVGAGNGNDVDLDALAERCLEVALVDVDREALEWAEAEVSAAWRGKIRTLAGCDVTGVFGALAAIREGEAVDGVLAALRAAHPPREMGTFDVVVSTCVLSQLMDSFIAALGMEHPKLHECVSAVRRQHLLWLLELTAPEGAAILVTDLVSSGSAPGILTAAPEDLPAVMKELVRERNCFLGVNPQAILRTLREEIALAGACAISRPWLWRFAGRPSYLVYAVRVERVSRAG